MNTVETIVQSSHIKGNIGHVFSPGDGLLLISSLFLFCDECQQIFLAFHKIFMPETLAIFGVPRLVEVIHVQLSHKTREIVMLEVARQNFFRKLV